MISFNRARRGIARVAAVALLVSGSALVASSVAFAASADCQGVFPGGTPDPIQKHADVSQAHPGDTVTITISWHSTAVSTADVTDCFRVGDGSNSTLNALVTGFNVENDVTNQGNQGDLQTLVSTFVVPSDPSLVGHSIVDRAKITHGSVESKSDIVSVEIVPAPCETDCPSPTPTPTVTETSTPTPTVSATSTAPTKVKGVTLGQTGTNDAPMLWFGAFLILGGLGLTGATFRRRSIGR
jgi:hypothetical protein